MKPRFDFADRVRAVLFDAGNTLLWLDHEHIARILRAQGVTASLADVRRAEFLARTDMDPWLRTVTRREGAAAATRHATAIVARTGADPHGERGAAAVAALVAAWGVLWSAAPADAAPVLDELSSRGFRVGCVSNARGQVAGLLADAGLAHRLACIVDSSVVGVEKPDPRIFRIGCERLGSAPDETLYVGDLPCLDVEGARAAGLHAVLLDPGGVWDLPGTPRAASLTEVAARL